jgi:hypothetical protein
MIIVDKFVDVPGFAAHVAALQFTGWKPQFVVVHNASAPSLSNYAEWRAHPEKHGNWTPEQWGRNLQSYYAGMGWSGGPHAFVCPDGILLFTPFTQHGTHSPAWNSITWGIETVGEFESEPFGNGSRTNLIAMLAILHARIGLNPVDYKFGVRGIHFHKEDPVTTHKTCPGRNMVKAELVADVATYMQAAHPGDHVEIPAAVNEVASSGMTEEELTSVTWLQTSLNKLGDHLAVDGDAGAATKAAVTSFQAKHDLVSDGIAGPVTRAAIKSAMIP